ncbi:hypothetical protein [Romboutsia lituseburensis]|uniref:DUF91 domain-containing protein n=1 Tax=Romboutsia lituseburensis DSM 797 TaxID=1121325 RepID=A0A1G9I934_9FIRM|nr:hypothetical protein [Romboutsia lituseburensis]CEH33997.1 Hypothetical protein RLITU_1405 [Romboutsia lituseburensis]SDL21606.1 hypothetical protein SAMN04515677_101148 [Romboutsia lituseburensis DSM 797]
MAGYIFSLNDINALDFCVENGVYSTNLSPPTVKRDGSIVWKTHHEGTFADYFSMKPGDNVYFFNDRKIYGVGTLININFDCKFSNYPDALVPYIPDYKNIENSILLNTGTDSINNRCICTFKPEPNFFREGIDIDDVLSSNPNGFKILRSFWKLSFIKIDNQENKALRDIILKRNENFIGSKNSNEIIIFKDNFHNKISNKITPSYNASSKDILFSCSLDTKIGHEMAIEAHILDELSNNKNTLFGHWDYISHQVIASPFKPIDYMDKMDIFGYRYIKGYDTISKYLVVEIKKDTAKTDLIDQVMKYVDWINHEYAYGDYSMIEAFVVASYIPQDVIDYSKSICSRTYTKGRRPIVTDIWKNIRFIEYSYDKASNQLNFLEVK